MSTGLQFPVAHCSKKTTMPRGPRRVTAGVYVAAVLEYLVAEVHLLAGNAARDVNKAMIIMRSLQLAIFDDNELAKVFLNITIPMGGVLPVINPLLLPKKSSKA